MENSRTKNSMLTMGLGGIRQGLTVVLTFLSRTVFINILGAEILGVSGLFTNILSLLALSELGIGTAITFYLYKPVAEHDVERINQLMLFYKKCYKIVGGAILVVGMAVIPFLDKIINFDQAIDVNIYWVYAIYVFNIASTYLFWGYKQSIFFANQQQYKIEKTNIFFAIFNCLAEILTLVITGDFYLYLIAQLLVTLVKNYAIGKKADKEYPYLKNKVEKKIEKEEVKKLFTDIYQVAIFKLGSQL